MKQNLENSYTRDDKWVALIYWEFLHKLINYKLEKLIAPSVVILGR